MRCCPRRACPHPPTISISLVRELTRSETEECGSVLRSDSSSGGCPGAGAVFTALPPAGNLGKERQRLRGEGRRAKGETGKGFPGTLSQRTLRLGCASPRRRLPAGRRAGLGAGMPAVVPPPAACRPLQPTSLPPPRGALAGTGSRCRRTSPPSTAAGPTLPVSQPQRRCQGTRPALRRLGPHQHPQLRLQHTAPFQPGAGLGA